MPRTASVLAAAMLAPLVAISGAGFAQDGRYNEPAQDRYTQTDSTYYDYARVIRVDPVLQSGYRTTTSSSGNCYTEDGYYADNRYGGDYNGGYDDRYDDRYNDRYDRRYDDRYDRRYGDRYDDRYDGRYDGRYDSQYGTNTGRNVATVIGGIVGAALGSKVGGGSARYATAAVGSMVGGMAGREIYETTQRNRQQPQRRAIVTVCDPVREGGRYPTAGADSVTAYDVTYEYDGREYVTRTSYHPGDRIRVRVDVRPE